MTFPRWNPLLDIPQFPASRHAVIADRIAALLNTKNDVVVIQAEAILALEAAATSIVRPGMKAINVVTSPYGRWFGDWMRRSGAFVVDVEAQPARAIELADLADAILANPDAEVLALVHAESASGICNPLPAIAELARQNDLLTIVDAVASVGGHEIDVDAFGLDIVVIGPQKALAGPAGLSAMSISPRAWSRILAPGASSNSSLSLADLKLWIDAGRGALPGTQVPLEWHALDAALDRVETETIQAMIARHHLAAEATRAGLLTMGAVPWTSAATASCLVTTVIAPEALAPDRLLSAVTHLGQPLSVGVGPGAEHLVRVVHTGRHACFETVMACVGAYGIALQASGHPADIAAGCAAVAEHYAR